MMKRFVALAAAALFAAATAPATAATAAPAPGDGLTPYALPPACVTVTLDGARGVYRPDSDLWAPWFDATVRGRSTPCAPGAGPATLAVTQYHVRDGATAGLMSTPWTVAARGATPFARFGRIQPDVAALCVSTGLDRRGGAVLARNAACVRPVRTGTDHLVTRFAPVPLADPLVTAPLSRYPADGTAPTGPLCPVDCLVSPWQTAPPGPPETTYDTPTGGATVPLRPYEPTCHTVSVTDSFAGPSDFAVNGFDIWMTGAVVPCPDQEPPRIHAVRYRPDRGVVLSPWPAAFPPAKSAQVNENTGALCLAAGIRERAGRLYGVHDLCWRIVRDRPDRYRLVPIPTDDPRVRKPLVSNIPTPDVKRPPGPCASCL
jgi:hypothetical protein